MQAQLDQMLMEIHRAKYRERRTELRESFVRPVSVYIGSDEPLTTFSKNVSRQGIAIVSRRQLEPGTIATLRIHSLERQNLCFRCEVRWCDPYGDGWFVSGWKFVSIGSAPIRTDVE